MERMLPDHCQAALPPAACLPHSRARVPGPRGADCCAKRAADVDARCRRRVDRAGRLVPLRRQLGAQAQPRWECRSRAL